MELSTGSFDIPIGGQWEFSDLTIFSSEYQKLYGFYYHVIGESRLLEHAQTGALPWRGGFSTVHFFDRLYRAIPRIYRPQITRIQYASPGVLELQVALEVALHISGIVGAVSGAAYSVFELYKKIRSDLSRLKLTEISAKEKELELADKYVDFIDESIDKIAPYLGPKSTEQILKMAPNKLAALKLQLTVLRRVMPLAELQRRGLLRLPPMRREPRMRPLDWTPRGENE